MINKVFLIILLTLTGCTFLPAQEKGMASYYSNRMHGRRMSDGTRYHKDSLTCAHKRYPLGTMLKVTNLKNNRSVIVKVTDRCGSRRIIDLSYAAAKQLGMITAGVTMVKVEKSYCTASACLSASWAKDVVPVISNTVVNMNTLIICFINVIIFVLKNSRIRCL